MRVLDIHVAARALRARAFRSLLTISSITVGCLAIVLMSSLAKSGLDTLMRGIEEIGGARLLLVTAKAAERAEKKLASSHGALSTADRDAAVADVPHLANHSLYASVGQRDVRSLVGKGVRSDIIAADAGFFRVFRMQLAQGRPVTDTDGASALPICVVGPKLVKRLGLAPALRSSLDVGGFRCRIVGVLADNSRFGTNFGFDWNDFVAVPYQSWLLHQPEAKKHANIVLETQAPEFNEPVKRIVNARLSRRRNGVDDFTIYDLSSLVERFEASFLIMKLLVGVVAGIALIIGGVGVMNMMLVSVSERVREIGVRRALGATRGDIRRQFLVEALMLAGFGGVVGCLGGVAAALASGALIKSLLPAWVPSLSIAAAATALASSLCIGVMFGLLPARQAARLAPVEAMRR